jgi:hypothetical protein
MEEREQGISLNPGSASSLWGLFAKQNILFQTQGRRSALGFL